MKLIDYSKAVLKTIGVLLTMSVFYALTYPASILLALTAKKQTKHPIGKPIEETHSDKYIAMGSSGSWEYWNSNIPFLKWWNNYEDGLLGEPSGKHSAREKGKERSLKSMIDWTIRNPFNYGKRTLPLFHCMVNDCDVSYIGDFIISDKRKDQSGWYMTKAVNKLTKRTYYGFRLVKHWKFRGKDKVSHIYIGFKIKPEHKYIMQSEDDLDKAFTFRFPLFGNPR